MLWVGDFERFEYTETMRKEFAGNYQKVRIISLRLCSATKWRCLRGLRCPWDRGCGTLFRPGQSEMLDTKNTVSSVIPWEGAETLAGVYLGKSCAGLSAHCLCKRSLVGK